MIQLLLFLSFFNSQAAEAQIYRGPISAALGGTGIAAMDTMEGALINPALVTLTKSFQLDGHFRDGSLDPGIHRQGWGVGISDNTKAVYFPGAIHYFKLRDTGRASGAADSEVYHVAVGKNFKDFAFGISGYRMVTSVRDDDDYTQWNYSLGALWVVNSGLGFGYVLQNIALPGSDVPAGLREDLTQGFGAFTSIAEIARLRVDITRHEQNNPDKKMIYMIGFENQVEVFGVLRLGYKVDDEHGQRYATAGVALNSPRLKIDYAFEKNLKGTGDALHSVDMRLPF